MCTKSNSFKHVAASDQVLEYQLDHGRYAVVVVMDGISEKEAKDIVRRRIAEMTVQRGDRYFVIESEAKVGVLLSDQELGDRFYQNMHQELIVEKDFSRERLERQGPPSSTNYPALRVVFKPYKERFSFYAIDACKYTDCNR